MKILQLQTTKHVKDVDFYGNELSVSKGSAIVINSPHNYLYEQCSNCGYTNQPDKCIFCKESIDSFITVDFITKKDFIGYIKGQFDDSKEVEFECSILVDFSTLSELLKIVGGKLKYYRFS